jgi:hypothetical protein
MSRESVDKYQNIIIPYLVQVSFETVKTFLAIFKRIMCFAEGTHFIHSESNSQYILVFSKSGDYKKKFGGASKFFFLFFFKISNFCQRQAPQWSFCNNQFSLIILQSETMKITTTRKSIGMRLPRSRQSNPLVSSLVRSPNSKSGGHSFVIGPPSRVADPHSFHSDPDPDPAF